MRCVPLSALTPPFIIGTLWLVLACGDGSTPQPWDGGQDTAHDTGQPGKEASADLKLKAVGETCTKDKQCATGVCWDYATVNPNCTGKACSGTCTSDVECRTLATQAGARDPQIANCDMNGRCFLVGTGLGNFDCP